MPTLNENSFRWRRLAMILPAAVILAVWVVQGRWRTGGPGDRVLNALVAVSAAWLVACVLGWYIRRCVEGWRDARRRNGSDPMRGFAVVLPDAAGETLEAVRAGDDRAVAG